MQSMIDTIYKAIVKPVFFLFDAEDIHNFITSFGEFLGTNSFGKRAIRTVFYFENKKLLRQKLMGIDFNNPIGLAAGFDYEGRLTQILPDVGFGFHTIGSVTLNSYEGNKKPRLGRLPKSKALLVNKGLKSTGAKNVINNLKGKKFEIPLGISIAKTNSKESNTDATGIKDYVESAKLWKESNIGSYYEVNISCPNAFGGEPFTTPKRLHNLLLQLDKVKMTKPVLIKMPIELTNAQAKGLLDVIVKHKVQGIIIGNLAKDRKNPAIDKEELKKVGKGNFSGKPTWEKSNRLIAYAYKNYGKKLVIVGCGGVFNGEDAYVKIKLGASLIQMITGMIFEGPQVIGEINKDLAYFLKRDGYKNIKDAVGKDRE